ncbi:glycosyltransferase family 4 protein [Halomarina ordinaria]|uniref:Glycosyltransferase family 4 protein n=1 Tax=Halomarina ordinaria TaxID=3033939 RepID=A0ABD5U9K9_9EURY|nr:glycosyltransferase family 4 protein [Halomarina sp. PSRA2]
MSAPPSTSPPDDRRLLQLHRGPVYPPSNGEEVRIWRTAAWFRRYGDVTLAHPCEGGRTVEGVRFLDVANPALDRKATRIYLWNALLAAGADNPFDRLQTRQTVRTLRREGPFDVVCCESPQVLRAGVALARHFDAHLLLNKHNAMFELLDQQLGSRPIPGTVRRRAVRQLRELEQRGIDCADAVVFQSRRDRERFAVPDETASAVVENGTDVAGIREGGDPAAVRESLGIDPAAFVCVFVGAYDYEPNAAAAHVVVDRLAPALPDVEFVLVGRNPPATDRENVHAPGFVDDLPGALGMADVALCPLTMGSGTKLKLMDYLAAGLPVVTTSVGAQGVDLVDGEHALVRETPESMVEAVRTLRADPGRRRRLADAAAALGSTFGWETLLRGYDEVFAALTDRPPRRPKSLSLTGTPRS